MYYNIFSSVCQYLIGKKIFFSTKKLEKSLPMRYNGRVG